MPPLFHNYFPDALWGFNHAPMNTDLKTVNADAPTPRRRHQPLGLFKARPAQDLPLPTSRYDVVVKTKTGVFLSGYYDERLKVFVVSPSIVLEYGTGREIPSVIKIAPEKIEEWAYTSSLWAAAKDAGR